MKTTEQLLNEIKQTKHFSDFLEKNKNDMTNIKLKDYLSYLLEQKGIKKGDAIRNADLSQDYAYQIFSGRRAPSRDKLICLALGMHLTLAETARLLKLADCGELYTRIKKDAVIIYAIENKLSVMQTNYILDEFKLCTLN